MSSERREVPSRFTATAHVVFDDRLQEVYQSASAGADEVISEAEDEYEMPSHESSPQTSPNEAVCFMLSHESKVKGISNLSKRMEKFNKFRSGYNSSDVRRRVSSPRKCLEGRKTTSDSFSNFPWAIRPAKHIRVCI